MSLGMPSLSPSPGQGYRDGSCDMEWQLGPGPETQKSAPSPAGINCTGCGGDRQVLAVVSRLLTLSLPRAEGRGAAAMGLDTCGLHRLSRPGREWLSLLPRHRAPGKAGNFPKCFVVLGFPSWLLERAETSEETAKGWAARSSPVPFLPLQQGGTWDEVGFRRRCLGLGTA